jgi:hypothetical protein
MNETQTKIQPEDAPNLHHQFPDERIKNLTPDQANQLWQSEVSRIQKHDGCDYSTAFQRAKILNPQLAAKVFTKPGKTGLPSGSILDPYAAVANAGDPAAAAAKVPIPSPGAKTFLGLPTDADQQEFRTAWEANNGLTQPRNHQAIWNALKNLWTGRYSAGSQFNLADAAFKAASEMVTRYPDLARSIGLTPSAT